ncbi:MAG: hypothetical protein ACOYVJ_10190 [Nitrospirota bacterium]
MIRYVIAWIPMLFIAIANGVFREITFAKVMSELHAHQLSTMTGSVLIGLFIWAVIRFWPPSSSGYALFIGIIWLTLTVAFEFIFGRFVIHHSWAHLLHDYNVLSGRLWVFFLLWITLAPYVFLRIRRP